MGGEGRGEADVLVGSGVRTVNPSAEDLEASRARIWIDGCMPTPSFPISVCGLPPSTPARAGHKWVWGTNTWHEVEM